MQCAPPLPCRRCKFYNLPPQSYSTLTISLRVYYHCAAYVSLSEYYSEVFCQFDIQWKCLSDLLMVLSLRATIYFAISRKRLRDARNDKSRIPQRYTFLHILILIAVGRLHQLWQSKLSDFMNNIPHESPSAAPDFISSIFHS